MNAINDALKPFDAKVFAQPFTPERILSALGKVPARWPSGCDLRASPPLRRLPAGPHLTNQAGASGACSGGRDGRVPHANRDPSATVVRARLRRIRVRLSR